MKEADPPWGLPQLLQIDMVAESAKTNYASILFLLAEEGGFLVHGRLPLPGGRAGATTSPGTRSPARIALAIHGSSPPENLWLHSHSKVLRACSRTKVSPGGINRRGLRSPALLRCRAVFHQRILSFASPPLSLSPKKGVVVLQ